MEPVATVIFPTIIWSHTIKCDLDAMSRHILQLKDSTKGVALSNYGGWQSTDQDISRDFIEWQIQLDKAVKSACQQGQLPELKLYNLWFNVNGFGAYNTVHNHQDSIISGVFYVDVPEKDMGNIEFYRDDDSQYYLPNLDSYNGFTKQKHVVEPEAGQLLLFPGWVRHAVQGNRSNRDRGSISFNYGVR